MARTKDINKLIKIFSERMMVRFDAKEQEGWDGWYSRKQMERMKPIKERIIKNALQGDWIDVANIAMFAWNLDL